MIVMKGSFGSNSAVPSTTEHSRSTFNCGRTVTLPKRPEVAEPQNRNLEAVNRCLPRGARRGRFVRDSPLEGNHSAPEGRPLRPLPWNSPGETDSLVEGARFEPLVPLADWGRRRYAAFLDRACSQPNACKGADARQPACRRRGALGVETLSRRARAHPQWKRRAFAGLWLSERCGRLARRMLPAR